MAKNKTWTGERLEPYVLNETSIEHLHRYAVAMDLVYNKKVLDIACGEGYGAALLAGNAMQVTGIDNQAGIISQAKEKYKKQNLEFICGTVENIPAAEHAFDVVVSFETLEHVGIQDRMITEIKRVMQPGGLLIISTPDKRIYSDKTGYKNPFHIKEYYPEEFIALLLKYFKNAQRFDQEVAFSSVITSETATDLKIYKGDYREIKTSTPGHGLYCIALASDDPLPHINNSLFNGQSIFERAVSANEKMVTGTITYKLGKVILYPAKLIRNLFKSKPPKE